MRKFTSINTSGGTLIKNDIIIDINDRLIRNIQILLGLESSFGETAKFVGLDRDDCVFDDGQPIGDELIRIGKIVYLSIFVSFI